MGADSPSTIRVYRRWQTVLVFIAFAVATGYCAVLAAGEGDGATRIGAGIGACYGAIIVVSGIRILRRMPPILALPEPRTSPLQTVAAVGGCVCVLGAMAAQEAGSFVGAVLLLLPLAAGVPLTARLMLRRTSSTAIDAEWNLANEP